MDEISWTCLQKMQENTHGVSWRFSSSNTNCNHACYPHSRPSVTRSQNSIMKEWSSSTVKENLLVSFSEPFLFMFTEAIRTRYRIAQYHYHPFYKERLQSTLPACLYNEGQRKSKKEAIPMNQETIQEEPSIVQPHSSTLVNFDWPLALNIVHTITLWASLGCGPLNERYPIRNSSSLLFSAFELNRSTPLLLIHRPSIVISLKCVFSFLLVKWQYPHGVLVVFLCTFNGRRIKIN